MTSIPAANADAATSTGAASVHLYREPTLLDRTKHIGLRLKALNHWRATAEMNAVFVSGMEFAEISREYVIAFIPTDRDAQGKVHVAPVALLGLRERENLYLKADGSWDARYVPAFLRRYPFAYTRLAADQVGVVFDASWGGLNTEEGELLLTEAGEPTPFFESIRQFLDSFEQEAQRTRLLCDRLLELELLRGGEINGQLPNGQTVKADGFFMIDEEKLRNLPDAVVLELHRNGVLALLHAHLLSMGHVQGLAARQAALQAQA
ncbi:MAG: hypothetical protein RJA44_289 [Pseudomonadota bacterium]|jgi:hypothetical protein